MQTPPPGNVPSNYPRPNLNNDRQILRDIASGQRQIMYCILGQLVVIAVDLVGAYEKIVALSMLGLGLALVVLVFMLISVYKLAKALGLSPVLYVILMFFPCISLLALLSLSGKATASLKQSGIQVGIMGADPNSI